VALHVSQSSPQLFTLAAITADVAALFLVAGPPRALTALGW
jgi:hypothetical protein